MSGITTHVLDVSRGRPAAGVAVRLEQIDADGSSRIIASTVTNDDGRCSNLLPVGRSLQAATYRLRFETHAYFARMHISAFFPCVEITFTIDDPAQHYHVPLLLSPFGYSTYRGS